MYLIKCFNIEMNCDDMFIKNKSKLNAWLLNNVFERCDELVEEILYKKGDDFIDDIHNLYQTYDREDFSNEEEYNEKKDNPDMKDICEWYRISARAFGKFSQVGFTVFRFNDVFIWGRIETGQPIILDFSHNNYIIKSILEN